MPVMALVRPGPGHDREGADRAGGARRGVGHDARRELVGDEQVRDAARLQRVPELVVLGTRDAEDAGDALARQRGGDGLGAGHLPLHARAPDEPAELDVVAAGRSGRTQGGGRRGGSRPFRRHSGLHAGSAAMTRGNPSPGGPAQQPPAPSESVAAEWISVRGCHRLRLRAAPSDRTARRLPDDR